MTILVQQQMTESDRKQLRELCGKATQGDWWIDSHGHHLMSMDEIQTIFITDGKAMGPAVRHPETGNLSHWPNDWNASYIVAVQPKVVRGLLDEIDRLTRAAKYCEDIDAVHENQRETMLYDLAVERDQLRAEIGALKEAVAAVLAHREGDLPFKGWLRDTDKSRDALGALAAIVGGAA